MVRYNQSETNHRSGSVNGGHPGYTGCCSEAAPVGKAPQRLMIQGPVHTDARDLGARQVREARAGALGAPARANRFTYFLGGLFPRPPPDGLPVVLGQFGLGD
jgi:hypothetical protein